MILDLVCESVIVTKDTAKATLFLPANNLGPLPNGKIQAKTVVDFNFSNNQEGYFFQPGLTYQIEITQNKQ